MPSEIIAKKLEQIEELLKELDNLMNVPLPDFRKNLMRIRAAERNFQLIVELASDVGTQLLIERGSKTPDTYRQSFMRLSEEKILSKKLSDQLSMSAGLRNILVHEYDFEEDYKKFYASVKQFLPVFQQFTKAIFQFIQK